MILGYRLGAHDDGSVMLGDDAYPSIPSMPDYLLREPRLGHLHSTVCSSCGRKVDPDYVSPSFRVKRRRRDLVATYDGYMIASNRFRSFCSQHNWPGATFVHLPKDPEFFWLKVTPVLEFDSERRETRFEHFCKTCNAYRDVTGARPTYLKNITEPLAPGFYRTDIDFACGVEQHPLIIVSPAVGRSLREQKFVGMELDKIEP